MSGGHFERFAEYIMSDDNSELAKVKAERDYALHCLEREIGLNKAATSELERVRERIENDGKLIEHLRKTNMVKLKDVKEAAALYQALVKIPVIRADLAAQEKSYRDTLPAVGVDFSPADISMWISSTGVMVGDKNAVGVFVPTTLAERMLATAENTIKARLQELGLEDVP